MVTGQHKHSGFGMCSADVHSKTHVPTSGFPLPCSVQTITTNFISGCSQKVPEYLNQCTARPVAFYVVQFTGISPAGWQVPSKATLSLHSSAGQGRENTTKILWVKIRTGRSLSDYCHRPNRLRYLRQYQGMITVFFIEMVFI